MEREKDEEKKREHGWRDLEREKCTGSKRDKVKEEEEEGNV